MLDFIIYLIIVGCLLVTFLIKKYCRKNTMKLLDIIKKEYKDADTWKDFITYIYWKVWPYDWRPGNIWYRIKCFCWYRNTTVRPRTMPWHTYTDKTELVPHVMFEMLTDFLEKECSPGMVDWEGSDHRIEYGGHSREVNEVMWHIRNWWHEVYIKKENTEHDQWNEYRENNSIDDHEKVGKFYKWNIKYVSEEAEEYANKLFKRGNKKEVALKKELNENLKTLVNLIPFL